MTYNWIMNKKTWATGYIQQSQPTCHTQIMFIVVHYYFVVLSCKYPSRLQTFQRLYQAHHKFFNGIYDFDEENFRFKLLR